MQEQLSLLNRISDELNKDLNPDKMYLIGIASYLKSCAFFSQQDAIETLVVDGAEECWTVFDIIDWVGEEIILNVRRATNF